MSPDPAAADFPSDPNWFPARVASAASTTSIEFVELIWDGAAWADRPGARSNDAAVDPAVSLSGLPALGDHVLCRYSDGAFVWEVVQPGGLLDLVAVRVLDRVCLATTTTSVDKAGGGTVDAVTGVTLTNQYRVEYRPRGWDTGAVYCDTDPADCCPTITVPCVVPAIPADLCLVVSKDGAFYAQLLLTYRSSDGVWVGSTTALDSLGEPYTLNAEARPCGYLSQPDWTLSLAVGTCGFYNFVAGTVASSSPLEVDFPSTLGYSGCTPFAGASFSAVLSDSPCSGSGTGSAAGSDTCCLSYLNGKVATLTIPDGSYPGVYTAYVVVSGSAASAVFRIPGGPDVTFRCSAAGQYGPTLEVSASTFAANTADCNGGAGPFSATWAGPLGTPLNTTGNITLTA